MAAESVQLQASSSGSPRRLNARSNLGDLYTESGQALQGSFSAVSKPNFANKYAFESSRQDLHFTKFSRNFTDCPENSSTNCQCHTENLKKMIWIPWITTPTAEKKVNTTTNMKENEYNDKNAIFAGETQVFVVVLLEFYVHVDVKMLLKTKILKFYKILKFDKILKF